MKLDLSELSKTESGRKTIMQELVSMCSSLSRKNELYCWDLYNNKIDETELNYLRKFGDYELPAEVKHIPKQKPKIDRLVGKQARRPFVFSVTAIDKSTIKKKYDNRIRDYLTKYKQKYKQIYYSNNAKIQQLEMSYQELIQQVQQQPKDEQQAEQIRQMRMQLPQVTAQIEFIKQEIAEQQIFNEKEIKNLDRYYRYEKKELIEELAQKGTKNLRQILPIKQASIANFKSHVVTGKQYYLVDYDNVQDKLIYKSLKAHKVFYPNVEDIEWTHLLNSAGYEEEMSYNDLITEFSEDLSPADKKKLKEKYVPSASSKTDSSGLFVATNTHGAVMDTTTISTGSSNGFNTGINVKRVWWLASRKIRVIKTPNPYVKGKYFKNFVPDDMEVLNEENYYYNKNKRKWISRNDEDSQQYDYDKVKTYNKEKKGQLYIERYVDDRYKGIIIDDTIFLSKLDPVQPRFIDDYSRTFLPIVGPTFNNITNQPYSLIWATRDIQKLINIVNYHRELMLAVAGTKVMLMDMYQKPEGMSDDEWRYQLKMGTAMIQTRKKGIQTIQPSFNQFQMYDMSLSASIQYLENILVGLDEEMGMIMGVTRQSMGQTVNSDQVGTFQLSQQSTELITELIYATHDEIERQALVQLLHLAKTYKWNKETIFQTVNPDGSTDIVRIPADFISLADFDIILVNNLKDENSLSELKQLLLNNYQKGMLPFSDFVSMYRIESLIELEKSSQYFAEKAEEIMSKQNQQNAQAQQEAIRMKEELRGQIDAELQKQKQVVDEMKLKFEESRLNKEDEWQKIKDNLEKMKLVQDRYLKLYELTNERESEDNAVMYNDKHASIDEQLRVLELKINTLLKQKEMQIGHDIDVEKIGVEKEKAKKMVKEHVSDK